MNIKLAAAIAACATLAAGAASADILAGVASNGVTQGTWVNQSNSQNFLVQFTLGADAMISGFDIDTDSSFGSLGQGVTIRVRNDVAGDPDSANLFEFNSAIDSSVADGGGVNLVGAHFGAFALSAGTYWMGMSGSDAELGWTSYDYGDGQPATQRQLSGEGVSFTPSIHTLGYQVEGAAGAAVPEPAAWAMMLTGFLGAGAALRSRRRVAVAA